MKSVVKSSFVLLLTLLILLCQVDFNQARPNSGRSNRRISSKQSKDNKAKRGWTQAPVSPPVESGGDDRTDGFNGMNEASTTPDSEPITGGKPVPRKWLEMEGVLPPVVNAKANGDLTLECIAVGSPPPSIYWLKDGKPIENKKPFDTEQLSNHVMGRTLFRNQNQIQQQLNGFSMAKVKSRIPFVCLRPEDEGEYTCVADNGSKKLISTTVISIQKVSDMSEIRPECEARSSIYSYTKKGKKGQTPFILSHESLHMEAIGNDIILPCRASGRPRPSISWIDPEGRKILNGKKFQVIHSGNLVIRSLSWSEMGEYTCVADNPVGSDSGSTFLYPLMTEESS